LVHFKLCRLSKCQKEHKKIATAGRKTFVLALEYAPAFQNLSLLYLAVLLKKNFKKLSLPALVGPYRENLCQLHTASGHTQNLGKDFLDMDLAPVNNTHMYILSSVTLDFSLVETEIGNGI